MRRKKVFPLLVALTVFGGFLAQGRNIYACPTVQKKMACCADMSEHQAMDCCKKTTTDCPNVKAAPHPLDAIVPTPIRHQVVFFTLPIINKERERGREFEFVCPAADLSPPQLIASLLPPLRAPPAL